jgi:hypothetical protein
MSLGTFRPEIIREKYFGITAKIKLTNSSEIAKSPLCNKPMKPFFNGT